MIWDHKEIGVFSSVTASDPAFVVRLLGKEEFSTETLLHEIAKKLVNCTLDMETAAIRKLDAMEVALRLGMKKSSQKSTTTNNNDFEEYITQYFTTITSDLSIPHEFSEITSPTIPSKNTRLVIEEEFRVLLREFETRSIPHQLRTPRALTRIVHGIGSIAFPQSEWKDHRLWGKFTEYDFMYLIDIGKGVLGFN
jgi:hypothetical protein